MSTKREPDSAAHVRYVLIRQTLLMRRRTFAAIARRLGVTPAMVTRVAKGDTVSRRVQRALARAIGMKYRELWGAN